MIAKSANILHFISNWPILVNYYRIAQRKRLFIE